MDEPADRADAVARQLFVLLVRRSRGAAELVEDLLGRPVRSRLVGAGELTRVAPPGLARLDTTGPVLRRHLVLTDSRPPHLVVAASWSLVVPWRLPEPVAAALRTGGEPLDRLLAGAGLAWTATPLETDTAPVAEASVAFGWAAADDPVVEQSRLLRLDGQPVAVVLDEVPFLPPRDPGEPLLPVRPPAGPIEG